MLATFKKEFCSYFYNMTGCVFLAFFIFFNGLYFYFINIINGLVEYQYVLSNSTIIFLIIIPLITMKLYAQEKKNKTDQLLFTVPVSITKITLGKYLAAMTLFLLALILTFVFPSMLLLFVKDIADFPMAKILGAYLGYFLLGSCFISVGTFISALTENQIAVSISTFGLIFIFYILDGIAARFPTSTTSSIIFILILILALCFLIYKRAKSFLLAATVFLFFVAGIISCYHFHPEVFDSAIYKIMSWFSLLSRFNNFNNGILDLSDIVYYLSFISLFLFCTINALEKDRY